MMIFRENPSEEISELVKISLGILLKNASYADTELCAIAAAKLHTIIQTRRMSDINEGCYILYLLNEIITNDLQSKFKFGILKMKCYFCKNWSTLVIWKFEDGSELWLWTFKLNIVSFTIDLKNLTFQI